MKCTICRKEFGSGFSSITSEDWLCATGASPALSSIRAAMANPQSDGLWRCSCPEPHSTPSPTGIESFRFELTCEIG